MTNAQTAMKALDYVLDIHSKFVVGSLTDVKLTDEEFLNMKECCDILKEIKLYEFDTNCSVIDLMRQVQEFINKGLDMK